jgi:hypothetical protein
VFDDLSNDMNDRLFLEEEEQQMVVRVKGCVRGTGGGAARAESSARGSAAYRATTTDLSGFGTASSALLSGGRVPPGRCLDEESSWLGPEVVLATTRSPADPSVPGRGIAPGGGGQAEGPSRPLQQPTEALRGPLMTARGPPGASGPARYPCESSALPTLECPQGPAGNGGSELFASLGEGGASLLELGAGDSLFAVTAPVPPVGTELISQRSIAGTRPFAALFG